MSHTVVIHQPDFLPHIGFFHKLLKCNLFIVLDHVQFVQGTSRAWTHRDKIKTVNGEKWLSVSVKKAPFGTPINQIELSDTVDWRESNLSLLQQAYQGAPFYSEILPDIIKLYGENCHHLSNFNLKSIHMLMKLFDIDIAFQLSSKMEPSGKSNELLVGLLKSAEATHYLSGQGARDYFEPRPFEEANIIVDWDNFTHPVYPQQHGEFIPYLSSIDLLFNCGIEKSRKIIRGET